MQSSSVRQDNFWFRKDSKGYVWLFVAFTLLWGCSGDPELQWQQEDGYRWAEVTTGYFGETGFEELTSNQTGVSFSNHLSRENIIENQNLLNGSGVAAGDVDGDGLVDLYFAQLDGPNKLYKNLGGFKFEDITASAGVAHSGYFSTGVTFADVDGDGDLDLLVTSLNQKNVLYVNDGQGRFSLNEDSGLGPSNGSSTMALADIDGDGDLDLYIANYKKQTVKDLFDISDITLEKTVKREGDNYTLIPPFDEHFTLIPQENELPERRELGTEDELYLNNGDGSFQKVEKPENYFFDQKGKGVGLAEDWGLTAKFQDMNGDGYPDLYVCNDFWTPDRIWINQQDGTFKAIDKLAVRNMSFSSMGVDFSDINRDGKIDFFVTEMLATGHQQRMQQMITYSPFSVDIGEFDNQPQYMRNTLHLNRGDQTYAEIAHYSNVEATGWSWATNFLDVDLDGYEDLIVTTGHAHDVLDIDTQRELNRQSSGNQKGYILEFPSLHLQNVALKNNGDLTFSGKSEEWGFNGKDVSHGMATADLDNDGDLDIVMNRLNESAAVFRNKTKAGRIGVRLEGRSPNSQAIGAEIELTGGPVKQRKQLASGGSYLSGSDPLVVFAADENNNNHTLVVDWPDGTKTKLEGISANRIYEIEEPESNTNAYSVKTAERPGNSKTGDLLFEDISERIPFVHNEQYFDDFDIQPLLPVKLSRLGPGVAWMDIDGDGDDDLIVGTGKGGNNGFFENRGNGEFQSIQFGNTGVNVPGDVTGIIGWREGSQSKILTGSSNYEQNSNSASVFHYSVEENKLTDSGTIPGAYSATGPLAAADYNGDGYPDLFVGGRFVPGLYPRDADSRLFTNKNNDFILDQRNSKTLEQIGLVTSAVFTDYDGDNDPDLLVSTEWGSLRLFRNVDGSFREVTISSGLNKYKGWWNGVATGDFNNDGRPDFVATNLGMNSTYKMEKEKPLKIYYDDFDRDQDVEIIESYYDSSTDTYVPRRPLDELVSGIPAITRNIRSYQDFAQSSLRKLLGVPLNQIPSKEINTLRHMIFLNNGDGFTGHPLPKEAQFTAAFNAGVADFDNDGNEDIFLSQNLFSLPKFTSRLDAGRGLWLQGDGEGNFEAIDGSRSGIKVYGEQRGAALSDFNSDGKIDLAVSQNGGPLKLYLNKTPESGITIKLDGPDSNKDGIGSSVRLVYEDGSKGPLREIQAGSGYWSQNSTTHIMGIEKEKSLNEIEIRWFNGRQQIVEVTPDKWRYTVNYPSDLQN